MTFARFRSMKEIRGDLGGKSKFQLIFEELHMYFLPTLSVDISSMVKRLCTWKYLWKVDLEFKNFGEGTKLIRARHREADHNRRMHVSGNERQITIGWACDMWSNTSASWGDACCLTHVRLNLAPATQADCMTWPNLIIPLLHATSRR